MALYAGSKAPIALQITVTSTASGGDIDLTTVTSASFKVKKPDGSVVDWTATMSGQTSTTLVLTHTFASDGTDVATSGAYFVWPLLSVSGGTVPASPYTLTVTNPHA